MNRTFIIFTVLLMGSKCTREIQLSETEISYVEESPTAFFGSGDGRVTSLECRRPTQRIYLNGTHHEANDDSVLERAKKRCTEMYSASPCVAKLIKHAPRGYYVVCGRDE